MRTKSRHMTYDDRLKIEALYKQRLTQKEIAENVGFTQQTISKELRRGMVEQLNGSTWEMYNMYSPEKAQQNADYEKTAKGAPLKIGHDYDLQEHIEDKILNHGYSPYAIVSEIEEIPELKTNFKTKLSVSTVYNYVNSGIFLHATKQHLPRKGKMQKRKQLQKRVAYKNVLKPCITERKAPRTVFGHWEMDCVIGRAKGRNNVLLVFTERMTRREIIVKIHRKQPQYVVKALQKLRRNLGKRFKDVFKSIAVDNGTEFSDYESMKKYTSIYYYHPYSSSERGSNENANAMIRRHIPKGVDMNSITHKKVKEVEQWMNNYPRKILGTTAEKAFQRELEKINCQVFL